MLIGSAGAMIGALLMFLQGGFYLYEAWHTLMTPGEAAERQVTVPVLEAVDAFLFGIVLVIFAYGIAIGFVFTLPEGYGRALPELDEGRGRGPAQGALLSEVVIVVLIVIFARVVVEANGHFQWSMLVLPASILMIALALRMIELGGGKGGPNADGGRRALMTQPGSAYSAGQARGEARDPHHDRARRQRAGRARARHRAVLRPRLQYRVAHRVGDRARGASSAASPSSPRARRW